METVVEKVRTERAEKPKVREVQCSSCLAIVQYRHRHKPTYCPFCGEFYWDKPYDEAELMRLQDRFLESGRKDTDALGDMYPILRRYTERVVIKTAGASFVLEEEDLEERCQAIISKLITYYLEKPTFSIQNSFGGYIECMVPEALWGKLARMDEHDSLNYHLDESTTELGDMISEDGMVHTIRNVEDHVLSQQGEEIIGELLRIVNGAHQRRKYRGSSADALALLMGLHHSLTKAERYRDSYYEEVGGRVEKDVSHLRVLLLQFLKDVMRS